MGEVYKARDARLGRTVAIKILPAALAENPDARVRFEREARAVAALSHPHIGALYDVAGMRGEVRIRCSVTSRNAIHTGREPFVVLREGGRAV